MFKTIQMSECKDGVKTLNDYKSLNFKRHFMHFMLLLFFGGGSFKQKWVMLQPTNFNLSQRKK